MLPSQALLPEGRQGSSEGVAAHAISLDASSDAVLLQEVAENIYDL